MKGRILFVDDEDVLLAAAKRRFGRDYDVHVARSGEEGLSVLGAHGPFSVVVSDMRMTGMNGIGFLRRAATLSPETVRIMLSGCEEQSTAIDAINVGGIFRFLVKPCPPDALWAAVKQGVIEYERARDSRQKVLDLEELAFRDELTGILNRRALFQEARLEFDRAVRFGRSLTVALIDVDHFKAVNDTHGHAAGDAVLRRLAQVLQEALCDRDVLGRYGGEKIMVVLVEADLATGGAVVERLRRTVAVTAFEIPGRSIECTISTGAACLGGERRVEDLVDRADGALYRAKQNGRNRVEIG